MKRVFQLSIVVFGFLVGALVARFERGAGHPVVREAVAKPIGTGGSGPCRGNAPRCFPTCNNASTSCPAANQCTGTRGCTIFTYADGHTECWSLGTCDSNPSGGLGTVIF